MKQVQEKIKMLQLQVNENKGWQKSHEKLDTQHLVSERNNLREKRRKNLDAA